MRSRHRILYERSYRLKNKVRLYNYRRKYEFKNRKRIRIYREKYKKLWEKKHPIRHYRGTRNRALKINFGIDLKQYKDLLNKQKECCAICGMTKKQNKKYFAVDHCHKTKKIRGLLCAKCNLGLGYFRDNKLFLKKAINYLCN